MDKTLSDNFDDQGTSPTQNSQKKQSTKFQPISLDESWISSSIQTQKNLFTCPVCFQYISQPVQCTNCQRLFCKQDYANIKKVKDCCPLCKNTPWGIKNDIHISYRTLKQSLTFTCQLCPNQTQKLSQEELQLHLHKIHNKKLKLTKTKLYKYKLLGKTPAEDIQLDLYQNLQINYKQLNCSTSPNIIKILTKQLSQIMINLTQMKYQYKNNLGNKQQGKINREQIDESNHQLMLDKQYTVWGFMDDKKIFQFYLSQYQDLIQQGYKQYIKNNNLAQIHINYKQNGIRYRIMYKEMLQVNVGTYFKRNIERRIIKLT